MTFLLADPSVQTFTGIAQILGVPAAMMFVALITLLSGKWVVTTREYKALETRYGELKQESEDRLSAMRNEKDYWRDSHLRTLAVAERATKTAEDAASKLRPQPGGV